MADGAQVDSCSPVFVGKGAMKHVIVDVDAGSDDALALMMLLAGEHQGSYRIEAITCTYGNTSLDNVCRNVLLILESMNRTDVKVFKGAIGSLLGKSENVEKFHGEDGFGDKAFPDPTTKPDKENAVAAIYRLATYHKGISMICLGPLTNLALALKTYPSLHKNLSEVWVMGGNVQAVGNVPNATAEFNFHMDPEAAHIVFQEIKCPLTILPWEPCINAPISMEFRLKTLGSSSKKHIVLLNAVEEQLYKGATSWNPCDAFLVAAFINEHVIATCRDQHLQVEVFGSYTRGQCVTLPEFPTNARVIHLLDFEKVKEMFLEVAQHDENQYK